MAVGMYGIKELITQTELGVGFEGAGVVTEVHESVDASLIGKTVAFSQNVHSPTFQGTWRQYIFEDAKNVVPFPEGIQPNQAFASFVNPLTVLAILDFAKKNGHKSIVHSAAASSLGKMLVKQAKKEGVTLINIVRRPEQVTTLEELGAEHILDSSSETFAADLKDIATTTEATGYFDPIGGEFTETVLNALPISSTAYVYGALSGKPVTIGVTTLIFYQKTVSSLWLGPWIKQLSDEERKEAFTTVVTDLSTGGKIFGSTIVDTYPLDKFAEAIEQSLKHASEGKIVINPNLS